MCFCRKKNLPWFTKLRTYENSNQLLQIIVNARKVSFEVNFRFRLSLSRRISLSLSLSLNLSLSLIFSRSLSSATLSAIKPKESFTMKETNLISDPSWKNSTVRWRFSSVSFVRLCSSSLIKFSEESESNDWLFTLYNADGLGRELPFEAEVARVQMDAFFDELLNEKSLLATCIRCFTNTTPRHHEYYDHEHQ